MDPPVPPLPRALIWEIEQHLEVETYVLSCEGSAG